MLVVMINSECMGYVVPFDLYLVV